MAFGKNPRPDPLVLSLSKDAERQFKKKFEQLGLIGERRYAAI
jgi:hypothetical protein